MNYKEERIKRIEMYAIVILGMALVGAGLIYLSNQRDEVRFEKWDCIDKTAQAEGYAGETLGEKYELFEGECNQSEA